MQVVARFTDAYRTLGAARLAIVRFTALTVIEQPLAVIYVWTLAIGLSAPVDLLLSVRRPVYFGGECQEGSRSSPANRCG